MRKKIQQKSGYKKQSEKTFERVVQVDKEQSVCDSLCVHNKAKNKEGEIKSGSKRNDSAHAKSKVNMILVFPFLTIIKFYKLCISPMLPPACRFTPTCSDYALLALRRHGLVYGLFLSVYRILRCQPFCKGGYDPVPEKH